MLSTPFDARAHLDGSRRAIADLVHALAASGLARPAVLVAEGGAAPAGARAVPIRSLGASRSLEAAVAAALEEVDVVHAWFSPRIATGSVLRVIRALRRVRIVQTVPSVPRSTRAARLALVGDVIVPTSDATAIALATAGVDATRMRRVPSPFAHETDVARAEGAPRDLVLYAGDWEFDDGIDRALDAFARLAPPRGVSPHLAIAARAKTPRARDVEARVRRRIAEQPGLRGHVTILGELPSLLPWIAAARAVVLPATTTYAKLDHPRVLLEAIALGVRIVVGPAPSLHELVDDPRIGEVARDRGELREAIERCFEIPGPDASAILKVLGPRRPERVAERYAGLYEGPGSRV